MALMGVAESTQRPVQLVLNILVSTIGAIQFWRAGHFDWRFLLAIRIGIDPDGVVRRQVRVARGVLQDPARARAALSAWRLLVIAARRTEVPTKAPPIPLAVAAGAGTRTGRRGSRAPAEVSFSAPDPAAELGRPQTHLGHCRSLHPGELIRRESPAIDEAPRHPHAAISWLVAAGVGGLVGSYFGSRKFDTRVIRRLLAAVLIIAGGKTDVGRRSEDRKGPSTPDRRHRPRRLNKVRRRDPVPLLLGPDGREQRVLDGEFASTFAQTIDSAAVGLVFAVP